MLRAAEIANIRRASPFDVGLSSSEPVVLRSRLLALQKNCIASLRNATYERLLAGTLRITVVTGVAQCKDARTLVVTSSGTAPTEVRFDRCLIATGAVRQYHPYQG